MTIREQMQNYVLANYPNATEFDYCNSKWGAELQFLPNANADEPYTCIIKNWKFVILREF